MKKGAVALGVIPQYTADFICKYLLYIAVTLPNATARMFIDNVSGCSGFLALTGEQDDSRYQNEPAEYAAREHIRSNSGAADVTHAQESRLHFRRKFSSQSLYRCGYHTRNHFQSVNQKFAESGDSHTGKYLFCPLS